MEGAGMSLVRTEFLNTETGLPETPTGGDQDSGLNILVIFTSVDATASALKKTAPLAESLGARITLLVSQVVPYPLPLTSPPVLLEFQEKRFRKIASQSPVSVRVELYLCRHEFETLKRVLKPRSLVVIGGRRTLWPTREKAMARKLRRAGHEVIFNEAD